MGFLADGFRARIPSLITAIILAPPSAQPVASWEALLGITAFVESGEMPVPEDPIVGDR